MQRRKTIRSMAIISSTLSATYIQRTLCNTMRVPFVWRISAQSNYAYFTAALIFYCYFKQMISDFELCLVRNKY